MKSKYIHMSILIQGPKQPRNNINLYLGLLQEELDTLWKTPAKTWDASKGEYFNMRATLITTVHDYLGHGYVAGQVLCVLLWLPNGLTPLVHAPSMMFLASHSKYR